MKVVQPVKKYKLSNQIVSYLKSIYESNNEKIVDFSSISWTPPVLSVLYSSWIQDAGIKVLKNPRGTYQSQICFGEGLYVENIDQLKKFESKNYLPVIKFSTHPEQISLSNDVISTF